jgi:predicted RNA-binding Zn-ribbon protein involved in translation (DUF1610 family)
MALRVYNATSTVTTTVTSECEFCGHVHGVKAQTTGFSSTMGAGNVSKGRAAAGAAKQAKRAAEKLGKKSVALRCPKCGRFPTRYMEMHFPEGFRKGLAHLAEYLPVDTEAVVAGLVVGMIVFGLGSIVVAPFITGLIWGVGAGAPSPLGPTLGLTAALFCCPWGLVVLVRCRRSAKRKQAAAHLEQRASYLPDEVIEAIVVHEYMGALGGVSGYSITALPYHRWDVRRADILSAAEAASRPDADPERIRFKCTSCQKELIVASSAVGGNVKCPECAASTGVPPVPDASLLQIAPEVVTEEDVTTLFGHLEFGNAERVWGMLTVKPAVATAVNEYGCAPITAVKSGPETLWLLAMLLENGADVNEPASPPLVNFAREGGEHGRNGIPARARS